MPTDTSNDIPNIDEMMSALARLLSDAKARSKKFGADTQFAEMVQRAREVAVALRSAIRSCPKLGTGAVRGYLDMAETQLMALERLAATASGSATSG